MYGMGFVMMGVGVGLWEWDCGTVGGICRYIALPFHRRMHHATDSGICPYLVSCFFLKKLCAQKLLFIYLFLFIYSLSLSLFSQPPFFF